MANPPIEYHMQFWQQMRWKSDKRYYFAEITQDLFGQWLIRRLWRGLYQQGGRVQEIYYDDLEGAQKALDKIVRQRLKKGYARIE